MTVPLLDGLQWRIKNELKKLTHAPTNMNCWMLWFEQSVAVPGWTLRQLKLSLMNKNECFISVVYYLSLNWLVIITNVQK